jgi:hypothetical protein
MRTAFLFAVIAVSAASSSAVGQAPYQDPWDPVVERAAEAAVARLGPAPALEIRSTVVSLPALLSPIP